MRAESCRQWPDELSGTFNLLSEDFDVLWAIGLDLRAMWNGVRSLRLKHGSVAR